MENKKQGSLLSQWKLKQKGSSIHQIEKIGEDEEVKLSHGQQRLWLLQQLNPENPFYNYAEAYIFNGTLHKQYLIEALQNIYEAHDILRTTYSTKNIELIAKIEKNEKLEIREIDLSADFYDDNEIELNNILLADARAPFDLKNGPVMRVSLYKLTQNKYVLLFNLHHIATDKWSMGVLRTQLAEAYKALINGKEYNVEKPIIQYQDYANWQRNTPLNSEQLDYWRIKLSGEIPILELPTDYTQPSQSSFKGSFHTQTHSKQLSTSILNLAIQLETTPFVVLLSIYYLLLYRYSGQKDILIGTPISNRDHKSIEKLIGFFNDTIVLRTIFNESISFNQLVKLVQNTTLEAFANKDVAFENVVKEIQPERTSNRNPFFNVMFLYHAVPKLPDFSPELIMSQKLIDTKVSKFDLTLYIAEENGVLTSVFEYATDLFKEGTIARLQEHFAMLLKGVVKNTYENIANIPMLTSFEEELFFQNESEIQITGCSNNGIHGIIDEIAFKSGTKKAVTFGDESISYQSLIEQANTLAFNLLRTTQGANNIVGLCMERSIDMIVGLLGILKAGCAYLPLDPDYPTDRIKYMLQDAGVNLIVTNSATENVLNDYECKVLNLNIIEGNTANSDIRLPDVKETDWAYVIYTSGSSGKPKGVPISHKNIINSTIGRTEFYNENPKAFLLMSSISFDSAKAGIFWTLCTGGNLLISEKRLEQDIDKLAETIYKNKVSHTLMLPSLYKMILVHANSEKLQSLSTVIVAGEACTTSVSEEHFKTLPLTNLYNEYGPTEATVWCIAHKIEPDDKVIPIGKPVAGAIICILNKDLQPVPFGAIGEIYIGGSGLSGVYLNRPDLEDKAYIQHPFSNDLNVKLYKTGDLGRYNSMSNIEFIGRADDQVKIRGFRIELEEIENILLQQLAITKAVVVVEEVSRNFQKRLVAFIETTTSAYNEKKVRKQLRASLPDYMVPTSIIVVDTIPQLPNGKTDKKTLVKLKAKVLEKEISTNEIPGNKLEIKLKEIWEEVLQIPQIGLHDNFFEIGGDSISSIQIVAKSRAAGIQLKPNQIFDHQTIAELAMFSENEELVLDTEDFLEGAVPLTPIQHWFFENHKAAPHYWNQLVLVKGIHNISVESIKNIITEIVSYHDVLRLSFSKKGGLWKAKILDLKDLVVFHYFNVSNMKEKQLQEQNIQEKIIEVQQELKLTKGGLFMGLYFNCGNLQESKLVMIAHHLVIDLVSWNIIFSDFKLGLQQIAQHKKISFKKKTSSIKRWGEYLIKMTQSSYLANEASYWNSQVNSERPFPTDFKAVSKNYAEHTIKVHQSEFDADYSKSLQQEANKAYNTKVEDILITTLFNTITDWTKQDRLVLGLERHGRNIESTTIDISNTVGWFTSFFPIEIRKVNTQEKGAQLVAVKEKLRSIPNHGIGYGVMKYLADEKQAFEAESPQIVFNYLGVQNLTSTSSEVVFEFLWKNTRDPDSERSFGIEINAFVADDKLKINWSYSTDLYKETTILELVAQFESNLKVLLVACCEDEGSYSPSDFPESGLNQDDLDNLLSSF